MLSQLNSGCVIDALRAKDQNCVTNLRERCVKQKTKICVCKKNLFYFQLVIRIENDFHIKYIILGNSVKNEECSKVLERTLLERRVF